jgi:aminoglycoside phosphotransferase (APT) family kinase protein
MSSKQLIIDEALVRRLVSKQFPQWKNLSIKFVAANGWDNRTFHLGDQMLVRMPSAADYALQVEKEHQWLPKLRPFLPLEISVPLEMGEPGEGYPWKWSIYQWLRGETAAYGRIEDKCAFATHLAEFLLALQRIDTKAGPSPGLHSFFRGGDFTVYEEEMRQAISILKNKSDIDVNTMTESWESALATQWTRPPVWVHGDISLGNLLIQNGRLSAVIDFGQLAVGDPACDLAITWTFFNGKSRDIFREILELDAGTWARGRAWVLWKASVLAAGIIQGNAIESKQPLRIINEVLMAHKQEK